MTRRLDCQSSGLLSSGSAGIVTANGTAGVAVVGMTPSAAVHGTVVDHDRPACVIDGSITDRAFGSVFCGIAIHGWPLFLVVSQSISSRQGGRWSSQKSPRPRLRRGSLTKNEGAKKEALTTGRWRGLLWETSSCALLTPPSASVFASVESQESGRTARIPTWSFSMPGLIFRPSSQSPRKSVSLPISGTVMMTSSLSSPP